MAKKSGASEKSTTTASRVFGYVRVSSMEQARHGESLGTQKARITEHARRLGLPVTEIFEDPGVSASIPLQKRPSGRALLQAVQDKEIKPGDVILATRLDRMFRRVLDTYRVSEIFKKRKISLRLLNVFGGDDLTTDGMARAFLGMAAIFAELESSTMSERIKEVKHHQRTKGLALGGSRPFGYRIGARRQLLPHPKEQAAIQAIRRLHKKKMPLRKIAEQVQTTMGLSISHVTVANVLRRP